MPTSISRRIEAVDVRERNGNNLPNDFLGPKKCDHVKERPREMVMSQVLRFYTLRLVG